MTQLVIDAFCISKASLDRLGELEIFAKLDFKLISSWLNSDLVSFYFEYIRISYLFVVDALQIC